MNKRWSRQSFLGPNSEKVLVNAAIGVVGLCGGGSHIVQQAAHVGIGHLICADCDRVDMSNTNRMVGSQPDDAEEKALKTAVTERTIRLINPNANVMSIAGKWYSEELLFRDCTAIFGCVDSFTARDELERFCRRYLIPYIDVGMDVHAVTDGFSISGQVIMSLPGGPCMRCLGFLTDDRLAEEQRRYGAAGGRPQVIWPNGVLASIAVGQMMGLLLPWNKGMKPSVMIEYDGNRQTMRESSKLQCLVDRPCPHFSGPDALGDPFYSAKGARPEWHLP
jgi:hypothetical protein